MVARWGFCTLNSQGGLLPCIRLPNPKLAPTFDGKRSLIQGLKVAAYSSTAAWVAAIFALIPALSILSIAGLYSLYLLYLGLPVLMKAPKEKAVGYTVVVILAAIVIFVVIGTISRRFMMMPTVGMTMP